MANKLQELFQRKAQIEAQINLPAQLAEIDGAISQAQAATKAEQAARAEALLVERTKALGELEEQILAYVEGLKPLLERRLAIQSEMAGLGNGWPSTIVPFEIVAAARSVAQMRAQQQSQADAARRRAEYPRQEIAELEGLIKDEHERLAAMNKKFPHYAPNQAQKESDEGPLHSLEFQLDELRHPGEYARKKAQAAAKAEGATVPASTRAELDAADLADLAEQAARLATVNL